MMEVRKALLGVIVAVVTLSTPALCATRKVNCAKGQTISRALKHAKPDTVIQVQGTCKETVAVTVDGVTIDGGGTAVIDGQNPPPTAEVFSAVRVDGARRVTIKNLTLQNAIDGLQARGGAAVTANGVTVQNTGFSGISIDENSTAVITDCTVSGSAGDGIDVFRGSNATMTGTVTSSNNNGWGISLALDSTGTFLGNISGATGSIAITGNHLGGIIVGTSSSLLVGFSTLNVAVSTTGNGSAGVQLDNGSTLQLNNGSSITSTGNDEGILVAQGAVMSLDGTVLVENNTGLGLHVHEAEVLVHLNGVVTIRNDVLAISSSSIQMFQGSSTISGTTSLIFGSRLWLQNNPKNTIGTITADSSSIKQ
jgi:hypothetical protein